jgi:hypothetical protein
MAGEKEQLARSSGVWLANFTGLGLRGAHKLIDPVDDGNFVPATLSGRDSAFPSPVEINWAAEASLSLSFAVWSPRIRAMCTQVKRHF